MDLVWFLCSCYILNLSQYWFICMESNAFEGSRETGIPYRWHSGWSCFKLCPFHAYFVVEYIERSNVYCDTFGEIWVNALIWFEQVWIHKCVWNCCLIACLATIYFEISLSRCREAPIVFKAVTVPLWFFYFYLFYSPALTGPHCGGRSCPSACPLCMEVAECWHISLGRIVPDDGISLRRGWHVERRGRKRQPSDRAPGCHFNNTWLRRTAIYHWVLPSALMRGSICEEQKLGWREHIRHINTSCHTADLTPAVP